MKYTGANKLTSRWSEWKMYTHPFELSFIPQNADKLIVGTFPTYHENYKQTFDFFYGSENNPFWEILSTIAQRPLKHRKGQEAVEERKEILKFYAAGITDMLHKCYRRNDSSKDLDLYPILLNDIFGILTQNPNIRRLILTSRTEVYGALGLLNTYFLQNGRELNVPTYSLKGRIIEFTFEFNGRVIEVFVPYSTSGSNTWGDDNLLYSMYRTCLSY